MSGYMVFWSNARVKALKKAGDNGPLKVIYGGQHSQEPSLEKVKVGDVIFPVALDKDQLVVMARLEVETIEDAFEYQLRELGCPYGAIIPEGTLVLSDGPFTARDGRFAKSHNGSGYLSKISIPDSITRTIDMNSLNQKDCPAHQIPIMCCSEIAVVGNGSVITPRPISDDAIPRLLFGNTKSTLKGLKTGKSGKLTSVSLAGHLRKMSSETFEIFESLFENE